MRKSKIIVTSLAVIFVILLMFGTTVFSDKNGMLNEEEQQVSNGDSDGDTLNDAMEYIYYGTDPQNPDTDGDGLTDGEEITQGTNPQDPNNPCTTCLPTPNFEEQTNGDTDEDTLEDAMEYIYYGTDPLNPDTDGDGLTDCEEITQGTDPKDPNDPCTTCIPTAYVEEEQTVSNGDSDGDMLEDAMEYIYYGTDPQNPDTDGDGLTDGEEITQGTNPQDPNNPCTTCLPTPNYEEQTANGDTDGDMLEDAMECIFYGTDPLNPDTDGDGLTDYEEITQGTNPRDPNDS